MSARTEREKRHALLIRAEASTRMNAVASAVQPRPRHGGDAEVTDRLRVEVDAEGNEHVVAVMGSEQDREPLTTAWRRSSRDHLARSSRPQAAPVQPTVVVVAGAGSQYATLQDP